MQSRKLVLSLRTYSRKCYSLKPELAEGVKQSELGKKFVNELKDLTPEARQAIGETQQPVTDNVKNALETLKKLHFLEIVALCQEMQKITGITDEVMMSTIAATTGGGVPVAAQAGEQPADAKAGDAKADDKKGAAGKPEKAAGAAYDIKLTGFPEDKKFHVLKEIRKLKPGMNLIESKKIIDELPSKIGIKLNDTALEEWKKALDAVGAKYEVE